MRVWRSSAALRLSAVASVAVLVAHWIAYFVAVPHAGLRDELLLTSGHGYWLLAVKVSLVLGTAALAGSGLEAIHRRRVVAAPDASWRRILPPLLVVQLCAFTMLEAGERILAGEPWQTMLHHDVYAWGLLAQVLVAPIGAAVLALLGRALRNLSRLVAISPTLTPRTALAVVAPFLASFVAPRDWGGTFATRGPPS